MAYCNERCEREAFRTYVADALKAIVHNTASLRKDSLQLSKRYDEIIEKVQKAEPEESQSGDEIIAHYKEKMRGFEQKGGKHNGLDDVSCEANA